MKNIYMKLKNFTEKAIYNDRILFVLSVLLAVFVWGYITSREYPDSSDIIKGVPIDYEASIAGTPAGEENYKIYDADISDVDIRVTANRTKLGYLNKDSFYAKVTTDNYTGEQPVTVNIQLFRAENNDIDCEYHLNDTKKAKVYFYKEITKNFEISSINAPNITASDGYKLKSITCDSVSLTGPEPYINMIDSCTLNLPQKVSYDSRKSLAVNVSPDNLTFLDENGESLNSKLLPYFKKDQITINKKELTVMINISLIKDLSVTYNLVDVPSYFNQDFILNRISLSTPSIYVSSDDPSIAEMDTLPVAADQNISLNDIGLDFSSSFDISKALESYPKLVNDSNVSTCYVNFDNSGLSSKTFDSLTNFYLKNPYSTKYAANYITQRITGVTVIGPSADIEKLTADDFTIEIDISKSTVSNTGKLNTGRNTYTVSILPPEKYKNVWVYGEYTAEIEIYEIPEVTEPAVTSAHPASAYEPQDPFAVTN